MLHQSVTVQPEWDRRAHARTATSAWVMLDGACWRHVALALDLSLGGMCITHVGGVRVGQVLDLWLLLPGKLEVECEAEVVRRGETSVGLRFLGLSDPSVRTLMKFLEQGESSSVRPSPHGGREGWGHG